VRLRRFETGSIQAVDRRFSIPLSRGFNVAPMWDQRRLTGQQLDALAFLAALVFAVLSPHLS